MDLPALLAVLRRRWIPLALCFLAGTLGALWMTRSSPKLYVARARLFVSIPAARSVSEALQGVELSSQLVDSYAKLASTRPTAQAVSQRVGGRFTPDEILSRISATDVEDTLLIDVSAADASPANARDIANAAAEALTDVIADLETATGGGVQAKVVDPARLPSFPVSPRPTVDLTIGALLGLAVGAGVVVLLESLDRSIRTAEQANRAVRAPVLAKLPRQRRIKDQPLVALDGTYSLAGEAYRSLRTALRFLESEAPLATLVVSSPGAAEGKTTVAANLAVALAEAGERVLVVDADLRRPRLAELLGVQERPGLTDVLLGRSTLEQAMRTWRGTLSVLPCGPLPPNPSEVLGSEAMAGLLEKATKAFDVVILDAPPLVPFTDAAVLGALVDGVLVVTRWGQTEIAAAEEARFVLDGAGAAVVGVVINAVKGDRGISYYRGITSPGSGEAPAR